MTNETLFSYSATTGKFSTIMKFDPITSGSPNAPQIYLTVSGSTIFGTIDIGGSAGVGSIFSVPVTGGTQQTLATFGQTNGGKPSSLLVSGSTLYGTAEFDPKGAAGQVFSLPVTGGSPNILATFNTADGSGPVGALALTGSTLYGVTSGGGTNGDGVVYSVVVPEPASLSVATMAAASLLTLRKRR